MRTCAARLARSEPGRARKVVASNTGQTRVFGWISSGKTRLPSESVASARTTWLLRRTRWQQRDCLSNKTGVNHLSERKRNILLTSTEGVFHPLTIQALFDDHTH